MSLKQLIGLNESGISDYDIIKKIKDAEINKLEEVDFAKPDGGVTKIHLPHLEFDPFMVRNG